MRTAFAHWFIRRLRGKPRLRGHLRAGAISGQLNLPGITKRNWIHSSLAGQSPDKLQAHIPSRANHFSAQISQTGAGNLLRGTADGNCGYHTTPGIEDWGSDGPDSQNMLLIVHRVASRSYFSQVRLECGQRVNRPMGEARQLTAAQQLVQLVLGQVGSQGLTLRGTVQIEMMTHPGATAPIAIPRPGDLCDDNGLCPSQYRQHRGEVQFGGNSAQVWLGQRVQVQTCGARTSNIGKAESQRVVPTAATLHVATGNQRVQEVVRGALGNTELSA
jgi:hypothetical protein